MTALATLLGKAMPDALAPGPVDDVRAARLRAGVTGLSTVTKHLQALPGAARPDADPTIPLLLGELSRTLDDVARARPERLPATTLALASTCVACHTRGAAGVRHAGAVVGADDDLAGLAADVRADVLVAARRFDAAAAAYRAVVFDEDFAAAEPWRWERAVRRGLALAVRVDDDPAVARALAARALATPSAEVLWPAAETWLAHIDEWRRERGEAASPPSSSLSSSSLAPLAQARRLVARAEAHPRLLGDAAHEVLWLRATAALHRALAGSASSPPVVGPERAEALALLGLAYERLPELDVWGVFQLYDAACVEAAPHTPLARGCFQRFERAARESWSGNSGAPLPADVQATVDRLRALARSRRPP
jgi:hypothetical protein